MPESDETQRFDRLLTAMLTKPGPDGTPDASQEDEDLREEPED